MSNPELMELAIVEAMQCQWPVEEEASKPKVGAVVSIDGEPIASAHRGNDEHAEKLALAKVTDRDLTQATVWTTLEPCTRAVRRDEGESCTERLIRAQVKKVVVGILDPNQGVCGKGLLQLQDYKIEVALFPHELALRIRRLNDTFIQAQQSLGITITSPQDGAVVPTGYCTISGTFANPPGPDVIAMTYVEPVESLGFDGGWWPQGPLTIVAGSERQWKATVQFGIDLPCKVCIVRASNLGIELVKFYEALKTIRSRVIATVSTLYCRDAEHVRTHIAPTFWPLPMISLPKGLDIQASIDLNVVHPA
jgi:pyrimidine deaminase RibD-like protein